MLTTAHVHLLETKDKEYKIERKDRGELFHYTSINALESIMRHSRLWVTRSDFLNDRSEMHYLRDIINGVCSRIFYPDNMVHKIFLDSLLKMIHSDFFSNSYIKNTFILSLTENSDSLSLWSNYSKHDGYNIGLNVENLRMCLPVMGFSEGRILYNQENQINIIKDEIIKVFDIWKNECDTNDIQFLSKILQETLLLRFMHYALFFKHPAFCQEEEYRIAFSRGSIKMLNEHKPEVVEDKYWFEKYRTANGVFVPYLDIPVRYGLGPSGKIPLSSICIGPKNNMDNAEVGIKTFIDSLGFTGVSIRKSAIPLRF